MRRPVLIATLLGLSCAAPQYHVFPEGASVGDRVAIVRLSRSGRMLEPSNFPEEGIRLDVGEDGEVLVVFRIGPDLLQPIGLSPDQVRVEL